MYYFISPVLRRKPRKKPGFSVLRILCLSSMPEIFSWEKPRNSPFCEFRGHTDFEVNREKSVCPPSGNREKCRPFFAKTEPSRVAGSDLMKYARAFIIMPVSTIWPPLCLEGNVVGLFRPLPSGQAPPSHYGATGLFLIVSLSTDGKLIRRTGWNSQGATSLLMTLHLSQFFQFPCRHHGNGLQILQKVKKSVHFGSL